MTEDDEVTDFIQKILELAEENSVNLYVLGYSCMSVGVASAREEEMPLSSLVSSVIEAWFAEPEGTLH